MTKRYAEGRATAAAIRLACLIIAVGMFVPPLLLALVLVPVRYRAVRRRVLAGPTVTERIMASRSCTPARY